MASLAIPLALTGISALSGLLGNRSKTSTGTRDETSTEKLNSLRSPVYDPRQSIMRDLLMNQFLGRTEDDNDFWGGYRRQGITDINRQSGLNDEVIANILASRGLGRSSIGGTSLVSNQLNRANQISNLNNQIPLLADARRRQNLLDASGFFGALPVAQSVTGENTRTGRSTVTQTDPGNMMGGLFGSLGTTLAGLFGAGAFGGGSGGGGSTNYSGGQYKPTGISF